MNECLVFSLKQDVCITPLQVPMDTEEEEQEGCKKQRVGKSEALGSGHDKTLLLQPQTPNFCGGNLHKTETFSILSRVWMGLVRHHHSLGVYWQFSDFLGKELVFCIGHLPIDQ